MFVQQGAWVRWKDKAQEKTHPKTLQADSSSQGCIKQNAAPSKGGWNVAVSSRKISPSAAVTHGAGLKSAHQHAFERRLQPLTDTMLPPGWGAFLLRCSSRLGNRDKRCVCACKDWFLAWAEHMDRFQLCSPTAWTHEMKGELHWSLWSPVTVCPTNILVCHSPKRYYRSPTSPQMSPTFPHEFCHQMLSPICSYVIRKLNETLLIFSCGHMEYIEIKMGAFSSPPLLAGEARRLPQG